MRIVQEYHGIPSFAPGKREMTQTATRAPCGVLLNDEFFC